MASPETRKQLLAAVAACDDKKGEDTRILELDPADSGLADYFLITSATNDRQVVAIADEIEFRLKNDLGVMATSVEGRQQGQWILLDYVDIVIHVFLAERRAFYDIERLRKSARSMTPAEVEADLKAALIEKTREVRTSTPGTKSAGKKSSAKKSAVKKAASRKLKAAKPAPAKKTATRKAAPAMKQASKSATASAVAPDNLDMKPPIVKAAEPQSVSLAASPVPKKAVKKAAKKAAAKKSPAKKK
jgi:ribosome-associated protein